MPVERLPKREQGGRGSRIPIVGLTLPQRRRRVRQIRPVADLGVWVGYSGHCALIQSEIS
jgi:hypothetical protein